jgi:protein-L-isoaspartate(D-aspartate) O-methyltransferase
MDFRPDIKDPNVLRAMDSVPRYRFVPRRLIDEAEGDYPLPIGHGQTISQPYIVALMTDLLEPKADDVVLEVGTGSGYQAAVLSRVVRQVYSLEIIDALSQRASAILQRLGYDNVTCRVGDGYDGWPEYAPYDGIIVTAASPNIPQPLVDQLKPGARLVIPIGLPYSYQELMVAVKEESGGISVTDVLGVAFVPLTRKREEPEE